MGNDWGLTNGLISCEEMIQNLYLKMQNEGMVFALAVLNQTWY
jgi:hypothetical protein